MQVLFAWNSGLCVLLIYMDGFEMVAFLRVFQPSLANLMLSHSSEQNDDDVLQNIMVLR